VQLQYHRPGVPFEVLSNPEFLTEGTAVMDLLRPSRVLIGSGKTISGLAAAETLASLYHWISPEKILRTNHWSSELAKLVSNAILAQRISSINTVSAMCEAIGADITEVSQAVGMDHRIGLSYLQSGLGFGGSCLRKDTLGLAYLAEFLDLPEVASYWKAVVDINTWQVDRFVERIIKLFHGTLRGNKLAIFGYAFKENTSDSRESQSIQVIRQLLQEQPEEIAIYDPGCDVDLMQDELLRTLSPLNSSVKMYRGPYEACEGASAVLILTPWEEFKYPPCSAKASPAAIVENDNLLISRPDGHIKLALSGNMESQEGYLKPGPDCLAGCAKCRQELAGERSGPRWQPVNWESVLQHMKQPRWVFDARRQVQAEELEKLGCKVVTLGQSSFVLNDRL